jgi:hypothetical protein
MLTRIVGADTIGLGGRYLQSVLHPKPTAASILFNASIGQRQSVEGASLRQLRQDFRVKVLEATAPMVTEETILDSLDITRLFPGHALEFLKAMKRKGGPSVAHKTLQRSQINSSERMRAKFLAWLGKEQGATGLYQFLTQHVSKLQEKQAAAE